MLRLKCCPLSWKARFYFRMEKKEPKEHNLLNLIVHINGMMIDEFNYLLWHRPVCLARRHYYSRHRY